MRHGNHISILGWILVLCAVWVPGTVRSETPPPQVKECKSCHRFSPDDPLNPPKGPDLYFAGNKFKEGWLKRFLKNPEPIRKAGYSLDPGFLQGKPTVAPPHPALPEAPAEAMAEYLRSLKRPDLVRGQVDPTPLTRSEKVKAKILFERDYGCIACHESLNLAGQLRGGISGPSLGNAGLRLQADWVYNFLKNPRRFIPKGRMPKFDLDDETAVQLTKFLMTLKGEKK